MSADRIAIYKTGYPRVAMPDDKIIVRVGAEVVTLTAGEWSALITNPKPAAGDPSEEGPLWA